MDEKKKVMAQTCALFMGVISQDEKDHLKLKHEGYCEWKNRKEQANTNNGKIGEYDFSYIFKLYEDYDATAKEEDLPNGPPSSGEPLPPPPPPAVPGPPPGPPPPPGRAPSSSEEERKMKKIHWRVLPPTQTEGDTIWSSSAKVDWDKVSRADINQPETKEISLELIWSNFCWRENWSQEERETTGYPETGNCLPKRCSRQAFYLENFLMRFLFRHSLWQSIGLWYVLDKLFHSLMFILVSTWTCYQETSKHV